MVDRNIFSERFKSIRIHQSRTITDIANTLNIKKQSVSTWENMKTVPSADNLVALADYFNVSLDYLVGRTDNPNSHKL